MIDFINYLWHDNVWSKVIAGLLTALIIYIIRLFYKSLFPKSYKEIWVWIKNRFTWTNTFIFECKESVDQNDIWYEKLFRLNKFRYEITIYPINTFYWRFGFRLSKNKIFPPIVAHRHENKFYPDLHISIGDRLANLEWNKKEKISFVAYHLGGEAREIIYYDDYITDTPVKILVQYNKTTKNTEIYYSYGNKTIANHPMDLNKFHYLKFFAWTDGLPYYLKVKIKKYYFN